MRFLTILLVLAIATSIKAGDYIESCCNCNLYDSDGNHHYIQCICDTDSGIAGWTALGLETFVGNYDGTLDWYCDTTWAHNYYWSCSQCTLTSQRYLKCLCQNPTGSDWTTIDLNEQISNTNGLLSSDNCNGDDSVQWGETNKCGSE